jgi:hypothetical protein
VAPSMSSAKRPLEPDMTGDALGTGRMRHFGLRTGEAATGSRHAEGMRCGQACLARRPRGAAITGHYTYSG